MKELSQPHKTYFRKCWSPLILGPIDFGTSYRISPLLILVHPFKNILRFFVKKIFQRRFQKIRPFNSGLPLIIERIIGPL